MGWVEIGQAVAALVFVLGLFGLLILGARKLGLGGMVATKRLGEDRRLGIVEVLALDGRRRAVLLKRDDVEHLVILGPEGETVVERSIEWSATASRPFAETLRAVDARTDGETPVDDAVLPALAARRESDG